MVVLALAGACRSGAPVDGRLAAPDPTRSKRTRAADGVTIAYEVGGWGRTALVFVHGWACDRSFWRGQLGAFGRDYRVVAVDLGGHGSSGRGRKVWSVLGLAGDLRAVIEDLRLERVVLVGHSMGGLVCLEAARQLAGRVVAVIGVDTLQNVEAQPFPPAAERLARRLEADFPRAMAEAVEDLLPRNADPGVRSFVLSRVSAADPRVAVALLRDSRTLDLRRALSGVRVPVRCLNVAAGGSQELEIGVAVNRRYADFDAVPLERVGHFPMLERPARFDARLRALLLHLAPPEPEPMPRGR